MRKSLALVLSFLLLIGLFPVTAQAASAYAAVRYYVDDHYDIATGKRVKVDVSEVHYPTSDLEPPTGYQIAEDSGTILFEKNDQGIFYYVDVKVEPLDTTKSVVVSFMYNGKTVASSVKVDVPAADKVVSSSYIQIPSGYTLAQNSDNGRIAVTSLADNYTYLAYFYLEEKPSLLGSEKKTTLVRSTDLYVLVDVELTQYTWSDGSVTIDETEAKAALKAAGYDVTLLGTTLDNGILWVKTNYVTPTTKDVIVSFVCDGKAMGNSTTVRVAFADVKVNSGSVKIPKCYALAENSQNGVISEVPVTGGTEYCAAFYVDLIATPVYRLYNPYTLENLFVNEDERASLTAKGWIDEGLAWYAAVSGPEVYRMYNPYGDFHIYTRGQEEIETMVAAGWQLDGIATKSAEAETGIPIYRLFNPAVKPEDNQCYHYYTIDLAEVETMKAAGWTVDGIAWYAVNVD